MTFLPSSILWKFVGYMYAREASVDIHGKSVDMDMDGKFHIHGKPANDRIRRGRNTKWNSGLNEGTYGSSRGIPTTTSLLHQWRIQELQRFANDDTPKALRGVRGEWSERRHGERMKTERRRRRFSAPCFVYAPFWSNEGERWYQMLFDFLIKLAYLTI